MKKILIINLIIVPIFLSACWTSLFIADTMPWVSDEPVLFRDNFTSQTAGWRTHENRLSFAGFQQGGFRLWSIVPNYQFWSVPGLNFRDTIVSTRVTKLDGPDNNIFGVLCRYQDENNFYALVISSDGYYGIFKNVEGQQILIDQPYMSYNEVIQRGESSNDIRAVCQGHQLVLYVNDSKLIEVFDHSLAFGDVGMIVGNLNQPGVDILFDYFIVVKP